MYREQEYTNKLLDLLQQNQLFNMNSRYILIMETKIKKEYERLKYDNNTVSQCEELVGRRLGSIIPLHAMLYRLIRRDFGLSENDTYVELAINYTLLGCVLDKLVDSKETTNRDEYVGFLGTFSLGEMMETSQNNILYALSEKINRAYMMYSERFSRLDLVIRENSQKACASEFFTATHTMYSKNVQKEQVCDKADKFTMTGILMALIDISEENLDELIECANDIGKILQLIDDLVDLYKDIREEQLSSLVFNEGEDNFQVGILIDHIIDLLPEYVIILKKCVERLKTHLSMETVDFIRYVIGCWVTDVKK